MTRNEFLQELTDGLQGQVSNQEFQDSLQYYIQYIDSEVRKGRSEEEVINELGSGRLIAKSIIDAKGTENQRNNGNNTYQESPKQEQGKERKKGFHAEQEGDKIKFKYGRFDFTSWYAKVLYALAAILLIALVFGIIILGLYVVLPVLVIVGIAWVIIMIIKGLLQR